MQETRVKSSPAACELRAALRAPPWSTGHLLAPAPHLRQRPAGRMPQHPLAHPGCISVCIKRWQAQRQWLSHVHCCLRLHRMCAAGRSQPPEACRCPRVTTTQSSFCRVVLAYAQFLSGLAFGWAAPSCLTSTLSFFVSTFAILQNVLSVLVQPTVEKGYQDPKSCVSAMRRPFLAPLSP